MDEMMVRLLRDHYEHRDGKVILHKAGSTVDLPDNVAKYIVQSVVHEREQLRAKAKAIPGSPERDR